MTEADSSSHSSSSFVYQPGLDGLRAMAVAAVVGYHLGYGRAGGGFLGVDAFFVLSGFLITSLLLSEHSTAQRISLRGFWGRRARRLLPAVFVMVAAVCLYAATNVPSGQLGALRSDAISSIFYFANWHFIAAKQSYFALFTNPLPLNHLWSLAIEEQFYLVWPVIVIGLLRIGRGDRRLLVGFTVVGIAASQIAMSALYSAADPSRAYYGTEARAHTILVGCLLAMMLRRWPTLPARGGRPLQGLGVLALAACLIAFVIGTAGERYFNGGSLGFAVVVALLILTLIAPSSPLKRVFSIPPLRYLGRISYGIYLWHWPVIVFMTPDRTGLANNRLNAARVVVTLVISAASFHLIEQPILLRRPRFVGKRALLPIGFALVLLGVFVGTSGATTPAPSRIIAAPGPCAAAPSIEVREAAREIRRLGPAMGTGTSRPIRLAVFGDSRACALLTGLEAEARTTRSTVADGAVLGCGIVAGAIAPQPMITRHFARSCEGLVRSRIDRIVRTAKPDVVLWHSGWEIDNLEVGDHIAVFGTPEHSQLLLRRMETLYQRIRAPGRKLVIVTMPEATRGRSFFRADIGQGTQVGALNALFTSFAALHPADVTVIDLARKVCPHGIPCAAKVDGIQPRAFDGVHFTAQGAAWAAHWMWPKIVAPLATNP